MCLSKWAYTPRATTSDIAGDVVTGCDSDATIASDEADLRVQLAVSQKEQEQLSKDYEHLRDELLKARELLQASQKDAVRLQRNHQLLCLHHSA